MNTTATILKDGYKWLASTSARSCNCMGPQNGEPLCPCRMQSVKVENGRYIEVIDHGPVRRYDGSSFFSKAIKAAEGEQP